MVGCWPKDVEVTSVAKTIHILLYPLGKRFSCELLYRGVHYKMIVRTGSKHFRFCLDREKVLEFYARITQYNGNREAEITFNKLVAYRSIT